MEFIFHGTGTSSGLPLIECLVAPPDKRTCPTCVGSLTPEGRKNARRNTGSIIRVRAKDGEKEMLFVERTPRKLDRRLMDPIVARLLSMLARLSCPLR
jgi:phosphoribosyl 1,2-cyclic phosphodiesterase